MGTYRPGDEERLVATWNASLPKDPVTLREFCRKTLLDANFDPEGLIVARGADGTVEGFAHCIVRRYPLGASYDPDDAWLPVWAVRPEARGTGLGGRLLAAAERYARGKGRKRLLISPYAPNYYVPGLDEREYAVGCRVLEHRGYAVQSTPVAMDRLLGDYVYPDDVAGVRSALEADGWWFGPVAPDLFWPVLAFTDSEFSADWTRALREALVRGIEPGQLWIAAHRGRVRGFALFGAYGLVPERFGPFGVSESARGLGVGKVLLYEVLREMKAWGLHSAWFLWTGEERPAGHLYKRAGFSVTRRFHIYTKNLADA